jgi:hypothetical protein
MNILDFFLYLIRRGTAEPEPFPKNRLAQYCRAITSEVALEPNGCCGREYGSGGAGDGGGDLPMNRPFNP